ncbi:MAG: 2-amino-4-hydroxy-6-hydroxymethyldihydropteridine diphosphokinase [Deltaproteobacteria bacterium]|nr:MAG: 2-amino-4-hydroxy-6-hydroxymethyldihydropteridine diphosphokinase [Deltaproteobacteria bacterium]
MFHRVFIGIGSNLGKRRAHYQRALALIAALPKTRIVKLSSLYESEPIGEAKNWYVNGVIEIETAFSPVQLLRRLQEIEQGMGRKRTPETKKWSSRKIDLDILLFDNQTIDSRPLKVPHPELHNRRFVLLPLAELAPHLTHPRFGVTIVTLLATLKDHKRVMLLPPNA